MFSSLWLLAHYRWSWQRLSSHSLHWQLSRTEWDAGLRQQLSCKGKEHIVTCSLLIQWQLPLKTPAQGLESHGKVLVNFFLRENRKKGPCHPSLSFNTILNNRPERDAITAGSVNRQLYIYTMKTPTIFFFNTELTAKASYFKIPKF